MAFVTLDKETTVPKPSPTRSITSTIKSSSGLPKTNNSTTTSIAALGPVIPIQTQLKQSFERFLNFNESYIWKENRNNALHVQSPRLLQVTSATESQPIIASNSVASLLELERDKVLLKQCYTNKKTPEIPQGLIIIDYNKDTIQIQFSACKAMTRPFDTLDIMEQSDDT